MEKNPIKLEELLNKKWVRFVKTKNGFYLEDAVYVGQCGGHRLCDAETMKKLGQMMLALTENPEYNSKLDRAILVSALYEDSMFGDNELLKEDLDKEWQEIWFSDNKGENENV